VEEGKGSPRDRTHYSYEIRKVFDDRFLWPSCHTFYVGGNTIHTTVIIKQPHEVYGNGTVGGVQFYTFFGIAVEIKRRIIDIDK
jgi:hypothetical protein